MESGGILRTLILFVGFDWVTRMAQILADAPLVCSVSRLWPISLVSSKRSNTKLLFLGTLTKCEHILSRNFW